MIDSKIKVIKNIPIAYVAKKGFPSIVAGKAFWELEQKIPLRGNKFFGVFDEDKNEYRACVAITKENQNMVQNFNQGVIPEGPYAYIILIGSYNDILRKIKPTFDLLARKHKRDFSRLCVEFYKRHTEVFIILPVI